MDMEDSFPKRLKKMDNVLPVIDSTMIKSFERWEGSCGISWGKYHTDRFWVQRFDASGICEISRELCINHDSVQVFYSDVSQDTTTVAVKVKELHSRFENIARSMDAMLLAYHVYPYDSIFKQGSSLPSLQVKVFYNGQAYVLFHMISTNEEFHLKKNKYTSIERLSNGWYIIPVNDFN